MGIILASPGYDKSQLINSVLPPTEQRIVEFRGLDRRAHVDEGEMSDMRNMTAAGYPLLRPRALRAKVDLPEGVLHVYDIMSKYGKIAMLAGTGTGGPAHFFYDGEEYRINSYVLSVSDRMVGINNKICFFPSGCYVEFERSTNGRVTIKSSGDLSTSINTGTDGCPNDLPVLTNDTEIRITGIPGWVGAGPVEFNYDDVIEVSGTFTYTEDGATDPEIISIDTSVVISAVENDGATIVIQRSLFTEFAGKQMTKVTYRGKLRKAAPYMRHVIEWNNRLWGASDKDNTIYASKLGDPKNWQYYQGTSLDSFAAQQGSEGDWTGCAAYSNHLIFFKQNSMTKIYGTAPSNFQLATVDCFGVQPGSARSVATVNQTVLYNSDRGIMAYDGGVPYIVSDRLNEKLRNVVAGTEGTRYYACAEREDGTKEVLVLDRELGIWHKEDDLNVRAACTVAGKLYLVEGSGYGRDTQDNLYVVNPDTPTETIGERDWSATFGPFDEYVENQKIYSHVSLRFVAQPESKVKVHIKVDDGDWELVDKFEFTDTGGETVKVVPRRCDRFSIRISGTGECEIKSLTRRYRRGSTRRRRYDHRI